MKRQMFIFMMLLVMICLLLSVTAFASGTTECGLSDDDTEQVQLTATKSQRTCDYYAPQRVEDTIDYLNEIYVEKYPELGLVSRYGDHNDKANIQDIADIITQGCKTEREKAEAIHAWVRRNITYGDTNAFPSNVLYTRSGDCLGYATLMQSLLRAAGIKAVWGDGWRGDLASLTPEELFNSTGHAWCWAYADGEWVLYDPLWLQKGTTDKQYMAKHMYFNTIETIIPVSNTKQFPPVPNESFVCYTNGRTMVYRNNAVDQSNNTPVTVLNTSLFFFVSRRYDITGSANDKDAVINGEVYHNTWVGEGNWWGYAYGNGVLAAGTVLQRNGKDYYMDVQGAKAYEILASDEEYSLYCGFFSLPTGYTGKPVLPTYGIDTEDISITWESDDPSIVTVAKDGTITTRKEGIAFLSPHFTRTSDGAYMGGGSPLSLWVTDRKPEVDYSDEYPVEHTHKYTKIVRKPTCARKGYTIYTCTYGTCAQSYTAKEVSSLKHNYVNEVCTRCDKTQRIAILSQPKTTYTKLGETAKVTVKTDAENLRYQWYYKNAGSTEYSKSSVTTPTYSCKMSETSKNRKVLCVITDQYGNKIQTKTATLRQAVSITQQPKSVVVAKGTGAKVSVIASGDELKYQWYFKDKGASKFSLTNSFKGRTYSISAMDASRSGRQVYCVITDKYGKSVKSNTVTLSVEVMITNQPKTTYTKLGNTAKITVKAVGEGLTYQWYYKDSGSTKYTLTKTFTGNYYSISSMNQNRSGRQIYCVITDKYGNKVKTNTVVLRLAASITSQPKSVVVSKGRLAKVTVKAAGDGLTYKWYYKNAGATQYTLTKTFTGNSYSISAMNKTRSGRQVYCVVTDKYGNSVRSNVVTLKMK